MKSLNKRSGGKTGAVVALCIVLVVTILLGWIGLTGMSIPPRGLYKVLSWLPTTNADNWPESLSLGLDLRGGMYVEYSGKAPEGSEASFNQGSVHQVRIHYDYDGSKHRCRKHLQLIQRSYKNIPFRGYFCWFDYLDQFAEFFTAFSNSWKVAISHSCSQSV